MLYWGRRREHLREIRREVPVRVYSSRDCTCSQEIKRSPLPKANSYHPRRDCSYAGEQVSISSGHSRPGWGDSFDSREIGDWGSVQCHLRTRITTRKIYGIYRENHDEDRDGGYHVD